ncbi:MAG: PAS domain S-box protein, partial [Candidatus Krumholzibacteria bacterium]|nr:PAS domain S-box protein [Candidatus Krumholzibacteria bacterium]
MKKRNPTTPAPRRSPAGKTRRVKRSRGAEEPARIESAKATERSPGDAAEKDFRNLAEFLPLAVFECDVSGNVTYANSCAVEYFGYTAEEVKRGINLFDVIASSDYTRAEKDLRGILSGVPVHGTEYSALRKDGKTFSAMTYASAIVRDGRVVGFRGAVADVTARRRAEEALKENEERFRSIIEKSTNVFYVHSADNVFTYVSPQVERILGFKPAEALVNWVDFISDNTVNQRALELTKKAIETGVRQPPYEVEMVAKDGHRVWFEVNEAPLVHDGKTVAIIGAAQDITRRRTVQEDLRKLSAIVHHSSELITLATPDGTIFFINEAGEEMLGISCSGPEKPRIYDVIPDDYMDIVRGEIVPTLLSGGRWEGELQYRNVKSGKIIDVHVQTFAIPDQAGIAPLCFANVSRDITERKGVEGELRERQAKLDSIFRAAPAGIGITASGIVIEVNDRTCEMTGYSREELIGASARMLYATDQEYDYVSHAKNRQMAVAGSGSVETCWRRKAGVLIDVLINFAPLVAGDPSAGVTFTALDITERRRAEEALRASEKKYRQLIDTLQEGIWVVDRDARTTFVNPRMAEMLGFTADEMSGECIFSFMDASSVEGCKRYLQRCMRGATEQFDFKLIRKDGERIYVHLEASALTDENGDYVGAIAGVQDDTERRRAEEALRQSEERFRTIVDTTSEWIWECRLDGCHTYSNPAVETILGYRPEELLEKPIGDFIHDDEKVIIEDILRSHGENGTGWRDVVIRWRHKDGTYRCLESNATPLFDQKGELIGFRGADRDVT